jgi:sigma-E factor negative regulatory protein RseA
MIKNQISALMDGELDDDEARIVLGRLKQDAEARDEWQIYHMIGDSLRQTPAGNSGFSARFAEKLAAEPTVLAPSKRPAFRRPLVAWSVAASLVAVSLVAWTAFQLNQPETPKMTDSEAPPHDVSRYLVAHQEYYAVPTGENFADSPTPYLSASLERQQKIK